MDLELHIRHSEKLPYLDLDFDEAARAGLTSDETISLRYIGDVESQTVHYLRELFNANVARDDETLTFLTIWNYEEFFHGHAIGCLLEACGVSRTSRERIRAGAGLRVSLEAGVQNLLGRFAPDTFRSIYLTWAASQEFLTKNAYEQISRATSNPILGELCVRIARQERRHFAWYFTRARASLESSWRSQRATRLVLEQLWSPVGIGVKSPEEARELIASLFPEPTFVEAMQRLDEKIGDLPGLAGCEFGQRYARRLLHF